MAIFVVHKLVSKPRDTLDHMGARLDISILTEAEAAALRPESSSSSGFPLSGGVSSSSSISLVGMSSSSSSGAAALGPYDVQNLFLFQQDGDREHFLGVCSPQDLETWAVETPHATTGLFRRSAVSVTFRRDTILDTFWNRLDADIVSLSLALTTLSGLREAEDLTYDFTSEGTEPDSSSSLHGLRQFRLHRAPMVPYPADQPTGYRLHVTCAADGTDSKIFLHRNDLPDRDGDTHARPIAVCSPGDLVDYPPDAPDPDQFPDHYRLAEFDVVGSELNDLKEAWDSIKVDVEQLAAALKFHVDVVTASSLEDVSFDAER